MHEQGDVCAEVHPPGMEGAVCAEVHSPVHSRIAVCAEVHPPVHSRHPVCAEDHHPCMPDSTLRRGPPPVHTGQHSAQRCTTRVHSQHHSAQRCTTRRRDSTTLRRGALPVEGETPLRRVSLLLPVKERHLCAESPSFPFLRRNGETSAQSLSPALPRPKNRGSNSPFLLLS